MKNYSSRAWTRRYVTQVHKCKDTIIDIDMKNARPTLLSQYCHKHWIPYDGLAGYINIRDDYLKKWRKLYGVSRKDAKKEFLAIMNEWNIRFQENKLYRNKRSIFESVGKMEENDHLVNGIIEDWGMNNLEGKVLNHLICDLKNQARIWSVFMGVWRFNDLQYILLSKTFLKVAAKLLRMKQVIKITFTNRVIDEGSIGKSSSWTMRNYVWSWGKVFFLWVYEFLQKTRWHTGTSERSIFYSRLDGEGINDEDYEQSHHVWKIFNMKILRDYHDLYNGSDY